MEWPLYLVTYKDWLQISEDSLQVVFCVDVLEAYSHQVPEPADQQSFVLVINKNYITFM